ncbi:MAG: D-tyrosyl-tRNA(Tyr) deacylase [Acidobacteria bacterium]|nr:MAG: D-tyrosyl-tRNA(Tyr) deacylase [Acidobacteriota bacterium]
MRAVVQRVDEASVAVEGKVVAQISRGLLVLVGVENGDSGGDVSFLKRKIINLRVFDDSDGRMNLALRDVGGSLLLVSQFTLHGETRRGNRPDFTRAASAPVARDLYNALVEEIRAEGVPVESGVFQAMMKVRLVNDGPVTLILDSKN